LRPEKNLSLFILAGLPLRNYEINGAHLKECQFWTWQGGHVWRAEQTGRGQQPLTPAEIGFCSLSR